MGDRNKIKISVKNRYYRIKDILFAMVCIQAVLSKLRVTEKAHYCQGTYKTTEGHMIRPHIYKLIYMW